MARLNNSFFARYKYKLNGLILILPFIFLYQSLNPVFPSVWQKQTVGGFEIAPMPYNLSAPYLHDGHYTKDFFLIFSKGKVADIRQAYLQIAEQALPLTELQKHGDGILHGSQHGQEVHGISPEVIKPEHKLWLTIENWQGEVFVISWDLAKELLAN